MSRLIKIFLLTLLLNGVALSARVSGQPEQQETLTRILFVFDGSQSMFGRWQSDMKITIARKLLLNLLDSLQDIPNVELALRFYGHQFDFPPQVCNDTRLVVPFGKNNIEVIKSKLRGLTPRGTTPIAYSLQQAGSDFPPCDHCRNIIILITDGIEECEGDPCAASRELQKKGMILKPFIIGIGENFREAFDCVGTYFDASSEAEFNTALKVVISQALNTTTAQVNLLDEYGKPTETNINMTLYDHATGLIRYNFIHTMNARGVPDTLYIDPIPVYDIKVHTIPPVHVDSIPLNRGTHTVIPVNVPQGSLFLKLESRDKIVQNIRCIVRKHGELETLNIQNFGQTERYLTGFYDLEVLCLPRLYINKVEVSQSHTTTVEIPLPGIAVIQKSSNGYGSLYLEENRQLTWLYNLDETVSDRETLLLQPGNYKVVFRTRYSNNTMFTIERSFSVESGKTTFVKLFN
jgi:Ca-activated chloride channel family protein